MLKDGLNAAQVAALEEREKQERLEAERRRAAAMERAAWAELYHVYERCIGIAEKLWAAKLETASAQQQTLAEQMRDRGTRRYGTPNGEITFSDGQGIPVPLFTPRDRLEFIARETTKLLISADRRNLTALYKDSNGEAQPAQTENTPAKQEAVEAEATNDLRGSARPHGTLVREGIEAASGADETDSITPLALVPETDEGERVPEAPAPSV